MILKVFKKLTTIFSIAILILVQSLGPSLAIAQEASPSSEPAPQQTEEPAVSPTPTESSPTESPSLEANPSPTESPTPSPSATTLPEESPTPTPSPAETQSPNPSDQPQSTNSNSSPQGSPNAPPTPTVSEPTESPTPSPASSPTPSPTITPNENITQGHLSVVIEHASQQAVKLDLNQQGQTSASLTTDKADYSPTDIVVVSGSNFQPDTEYTLIITSNDPPAVNFETKITADSRGNFIYSYQLDGNYRPNYQVEVKDSSGTVIASTTFTDSSTTVNSVSVGSQTGSVTYGTSGSVTYSVSVNATTSGNGPSVGFSISGLPTGATSSFSPTTVSFVNNTTSTKTTTLTITSASSNPAASTPFTVTTTGATTNKFGSGILNISKKTLTASITANNKIYDGTNTATIATCTLSGVLAADSGNVICSASGATFSDKNVGNGKTVTATGITLGGSAAGNYSLSSTSATTTADITARPITVTATTNTKTYDGTTTAAAIPTRTAGTLAAGDTETLSETYDTKNKGTGKILTPAASIKDGSNMDMTGNYNITPVTNTGEITAKDLTITATTNTKTYDANTSATAIPIVTGLQGSDTVTDLAETYNNPNAGTGKTLSVSAYTINDGNSGNNYTVNTASDSTGVINARALTVTANNLTKTYGQTVSFAGTEFTSPGLQNGETIGSVSLISAGSLATAGVTASPYSITPSAATGGTFNANNYSITYNNGQLTVNPSPLTVTADTKSKTYGSPDPSLTYGITSGALVNGDTFTGALTRNPGENVGTYAITQGSLALSNNYNLTYAGANLTINKATPTVTVNSVTADYDGNPHGTTGTVSNGLGDATISYSGTGSTTYGPSATAPTNAGTYLATGSFAGNSNYNSATGTATITINASILVNSSSPNVTITNSGVDSTITVPSDVNNATLDVSSVSSTSGGTTTATLNNNITINAATSVGNVTVAIPGGTQISGASSDWTTGIINVPTVQANSSVSVPPPSGFTTSTNSVVEIGFGDVPLTLNKGVRISLAGQAGKLVGFSRGGVFTAITNTCSSNSQAVGDALSGGECKIDVGSDLIIWTQHFTKFVTYTQTQTTSTTGGGGGGGDGLGCAVNDCSVRTSAANPAAGFAAVLGISTTGQGNLGVGEKEGQVQGESTTSAQPTITTQPSQTSQPQTSAGSPLNIKTIAIVIIILLLVFGIFKLVRV